MGVIWSYWELADKCSAVVVLSANSIDEVD